MRIEIWFDRTDPPDGRVGAVAGAEPMPFRGWIDLIAVLSRLLDTVRDEDSELGPGPQPELGQDV